MRATLLLADSAQMTASGTINATGLGWTRISNPVPPIALVLFVEVPWNQAGDVHAFRVELVDADGHAVSVQNPDGSLTTVGGDGQFKASLEPGAPPGTPASSAASLSMSALSLTPGRYEWRLIINGRAHRDWTAAFTVH